MALPTPTPQRQLDIGPASWFRPEALDPAANQVRVKAGWTFSGALAIYDRFTSGDQLTGGFAVVASGFHRYDLVYLDATGAVQIAQGTAVLTSASDFEGAPGWISGGTPGPDIPGTATPICWVKITETATVVVDTADIIQLNGFIRISREIDGYFVDKGLFGSAPTGASDDVSALFAAETPGGSGTVRGVITTPPDNKVTLLDQKKDEVKHTTGARIFGRLTESSGTWTLSYFYINSSGVETAITTIETENDQGAGLTDIQLFQTPKTFSRQDPNRPLFASPLVQLSDQAAADIPLATTTVAGKVELATDGENAASVAVQGNDTRVNSPLKTQDSGGTPTTNSPHDTMRAGTGMSFADLGGGVVQINGPSGLVPVGLIGMWWRPNTTNPIPTDWLVCDGQTVADAGSIFNGQAVPNLQDKFPRGLNNASLPTYGGPGAPPTAGADSHSHTHNHVHSLNSHTHTHSHTHSISSDGAHDHIRGPVAGFSALQGDGFRTSTDGSHDHTGSTGSESVSTTSGPSTSNTGSENPSGTSSNSNVPAYVGLVFIIKIK